MRTRKSILSVTEAKNRKADRDRRGYLRKLKIEGKNTKDELIKQRRNEIRGLLAANKSMEDIRNILSISRATYYRDIDAINTEDSIKKLSEL